MRRATEHHKLRGRLVLETDVGIFLGSTRIRLLEGIGLHGSISKAAKAIPLSYKAAWDAVDAMNNLADQPLVERTIGGHRGGGTRLTDYGRRMVAYYRALEENYQELLDRTAAQLNESAGDDIGAFRALLHRMAMKTSARNQFAGPISALRASAMNVEVLILLDEHTEITASVTKESAERLDLRLGKEVHALVKAPSVTLLSPDATPAHNRFRGTIASLQVGNGKGEAILALLGGRTLVALVTQESVERHGLREGATACVHIDPSSVILATFG